MSDDGKPDDGVPVIVDTEERTVEAKLTPPSDAAGWRDLLSHLPSSAVLKILQEEKGRAERIFAGFRPNPSGLNLPIVRDRLIKEAQKLPKLAEALVSLAPRQPKNETGTKSAPSVRTPIPSPADDSDTIAAIRVKLEKHRATILVNEERIRELERRLAETEREAHRARTDAEAAHIAQRHTQERLERLQRQKEREDRRPATPSPPREKTVIYAAPVPAPVTIPLIFEETIQRILDAGKAGTVVDLCRYALRTNSAEESATIRGQVHSFLADALKRNGDIAGSISEGREAVHAFLDGGDACGAANALALWATQTNVIRKEDAANISRLLKLAEATGKQKDVQDIFLRLSLSSPNALKKIRAALPPGEAAKLKLETTTAAPPPFGANEVFSMPVVPHALSPRRIVRAVDSGEEKLVEQVRAGIAEWRRRDKSGNQYADALLAAIEKISPAVSVPLRHTPREAVVVDASNVARRTPDPLVLETTGRVAYLIAMRDHLLREGYFPVILIADANLGYQIDDPTAYLSLMDRRILIEVPGGESADETLIWEARQRRAPLVTNDRLRDWQQNKGDIHRLEFVILPDRILLQVAPDSAH
jgi:hypothetical protein